MKDIKQKKIFYLYLDRLNILLQQKEDFIWLRHEYVMQNQFDKAQIIEQKYIIPLRNKVKLLAKIIEKEIKNE